MGRIRQVGLRSTTYQRMGAIAALSAQMIPREAPGEGPVVTMEAHFSRQVPSEVNGAPDTPVMAIHTLSTENTEPLQFNRARILMAARSDFAREQAEPVVYIIRYMYSPASPQDPDTGGK